MILEELISAGLSELKLTLAENGIEKIRSYYELLMERNKEFNLTAIKGEEDAAHLHFVDSIALLGTYDFKDKRVIDIGTGAGFPGIPLIIAEPTIELTLMDSTGKKVDFLWEVCENLGIDADCLHMRAEDAALDDTMRECYDIAVSRAVARLNVLSELCLPFVKKGGAFIAMKASDSDEEIEEAKNAIKLLGGKIERIAEYPIPGTDIVRRAVIIEKIAPTPQKYPRRFSKIQKSPL